VSGVTLIVVGAGKGSPGVSTTALALAAAWQGRPRPVVWEADPQGGDLQLRFGIPEEPGLVTLAGAARAEGLTAKTAAAHVQRLPGGVTVVAGPVAAAPAQAALAELDPLWAQAEPEPEVWLVDAGRISTAGQEPTGLLRAADVVVLVARGTVEALAHAAQAADHVTSLGVRAVLVAVVGECRYSDAEIVEALRVAQCVRLPHDARSAELLRGGPAGPGTARFGRQPRYPLLGAARELASAVQSRLPAAVQPEVLSVPEEPPVYATSLADSVNLAVRGGRL
jgi:MinD-like ATPase involved in chromosome partitioning or flagellar assembly